MVAVSLGYTVRVKRLEELRSAESGKGKTQIYLTKTAQGFNKLARFGIVRRVLSHISIKRPEPRSHTHFEININTVKAEVFQ